MENNNSVISVFGATGLIGQNVVKMLHGEGYTIRIFARDTDRSRKLFPEIDDQIAWNYSSENWKASLAGSGAVINFSGAPIFKKWKGDYRKEIWNSRVEATSQIVDAMSRLEQKPAIFINGSAAGIYGYDTFDDSDVTEASPPGKDFWGELVSAWEKAANEAERFGTRVVNIRTTVVLDRDYGALPQLVSVFRKGIGGPISPGNQWFPWIHIEDEVGLVMFAMENDSVSGPINAGSPDVPRMEDFAHTLGEVMHKQSRVKIPLTLIRLMMGEVSNVLAKGKKVVPARALELGFKFRFVKLRDALEDLLKQ